MESNETIFNGNHILGKDVYIDGKHRVEDITFNKYLHELGFGIEFKENIDNVKDIAVVWYYDGGNGGDIYIEQIYDHDTGEIFWEDKDEYTNEDEDLVNALVMYGNLQETIGMNYV